MKIKKFPKGVQSRCIEWTGTISKEGYAVCYKNLKQYRVSRMFYFGVFPKTDKKLVIDHICRNRKCVNLCHLRAITNVKNIMIGESPLAMNARKTHCKYGHEFTKENIIIDKRFGRGMCRKCNVRRTQDWRATIQKSKDFRDKIYADHN